MPNSIEQHRINVDVAFREWMQILALTGIGSEQESGAFIRYQQSKWDFQSRILKEGSITAEIAALCMGMRDVK
jgi:hypothetical protein